MYIIGKQVYPTTKGKPKGESREEFKELRGKCELQQYFFSSNLFH